MLAAQRVRHDTLHPAPPATPDDSPPHPHPRGGPPIDRDAYARPLQSLADALASDAPTRRSSALASDAPTAPSSRSPCHLPAVPMASPRALESALSEIV